MIIILYQLVENLRVGPLRPFICNEMLFFQGNFSWAKIWSQTWPSRNDQWLHFMVKYLAVYLAQHITSSLHCIHTDKFHIHIASGDDFLPMWGITLVMSIAHGLGKWHLVLHTQILGLYSRIVCLMASSHGPHPCLPCTAQPKSHSWFVSRAHRQLIMIRPWCMPQLPDQFIYTGPIGDLPSYATCSWCGHKRSVLQIFDFENPVSLLCCTGNDRLKSSHEMSSWPSRTPNPTGWLAALLEIPTLEFSQPHHDKSVVSSWLPRLTRQGREK